jgi:hypothetical protein
MAKPRPGWRRTAAEWWRDAQWYLLGGMAIAAFLLGTVGFQQWYAAHDIADASVWDAAYKSLQLFTLESGSADAPVPPLLNVARFLAVVAALYGAAAALLAVFGERLARFRLRSSKGFAVVCGLGDRGFHITEELLKRGMRVAVIDRDEHAPLLERARAAGAVVVIGDASDVSVLRKVRADRAAYLVAVCPEDGDNAEIAVRLAELVGERSLAEPVTAITHIYDTELCDLLREQTELGGAPRGVNLHFFNVPESGADAMLDAVPPQATRKERTPHIVVVGAGKLGRSLVVKAAQMWLRERAAGSPLPRVTLIDQSAAAKAELLRVRFPQIDDACTLIPLTMPKNAPEFERGDFLYDPAGVVDVDAVYVCPDDDVHSAAAALMIERHTRGSNVTIAVRMTRRGGLAAFLLSRAEGGLGDIRAVGVLDYACDPASLLTE